jgi:hypothetical protein
MHCSKHAQRKEKKKKPFFAKGAYIEAREKSSLAIFFLWNKLTLQNNVTKLLLRMTKNVSLSQRGAPKDMTRKKISDHKVVVGGSLINCFL